MTGTYKIWIVGQKVTTSDFNQVCAVKGIKRVGRSAAQDRASRGRTDRPKVFGADATSLTTKEYVAKWLKDNFLKA